MSIQSYLDMQKFQYDRDAAHWSLSHRDPVVGSYDAHNAWSDYDKYLFKDFDTNGLIALEYGCGPGRNIIRYHNRFKRIDGVDISSVVLEKAKINISNAGFEIPNLIHTNGKAIPCDNETYDVVFSTICLQHICVYEIRNAIMKEIYRVLKPGGYICIQMGYGGKERDAWVKYFDNHYGAEGTNGLCDISIDDQDVLEKDLNKIGFIAYKSDILPVGPGDNHRNWIFFRRKSKGNTWAKLKI